MNKLIIKNQSQASDIEAVQLVLDIMKLGRISNNGTQYCYYTTHGKLGVASYLNKESDRFVVEDMKP